MKIVLSVVGVLVLVVMTKGLIVEQLCPLPLRQAAFSPWWKKEGGLHSRDIVYQKYIRDLPNNSFVFAPNAQVPRHQA